MSLLAKFISYVFQPLLMPSLVFYTVLFHLGNSSNLTDQGKWNVIFLILITTCLVPMLTVIMFRVTNVIKDLHMTTRKERFMPFMFITIFYVVVAIMIRSQVWMTPELELVFFSIAFVVFLTNLITFFWKISAHTAGVAGLLGFVLAFQQTYSATSDLFWPLVISILLTGVVSWSRLYLNAHKPSEIFGGISLGFIITFGAVILFL